MVDRQWALLATAWVTWILVHIFYLIGFENRIIVISRWSYSFLSRGRSTRLITEVASYPRATTRPPST